MVVSVRRVAQASVVSARTITPILPAALLLAAVPTMVAALRGRSDFVGAVEAAAIFAGAALGFAVDDPAALTLEPSPTTLVERRLARLVPSVALVAVVVGALAWLASRWSAVPLPLGFIAVELCAAAGGSLAIAAAARTDGPVLSGLGGALGALLLLGLVTSLATRYSGLPMINQREFHDRWWWLAALGAAAAVWGSLDPGRPRRLLRL